MFTTVVIGGGITGLSTLYYLQKELQGKAVQTEMVLIEADPRLGGKIRTLTGEDFIMETGADSIVARKPNILPLLAELGLEDEVVYNATGTSYIYTADGLKKIPSDAVFGIPAGLQSLAESELVSDTGKVAALKDFYTPNQTFTEKDSLGAFLEAFLGKEMVDKQIAPVVSGVYSGDIYDLTIASTFPYLLKYKNEYGSIIRGMEKNRELYLKSDGKKFISFRNGVSALVDRMEERLDQARIEKGVRALSLNKQGDRYAICLEDGREILADCVVLANSSRHAQELLQDEVMAEDFKQLKTKSMISVYLGFDIPDSRLPSDGTGFISAHDSGALCDACTWTSRKWRHTSKDGRLLVRLFYKSSNSAYGKLSRLTELGIQETAMQDIEKCLGISDPPVSVEVTHWHENMPNYHMGHRDIVQSLEAKLSTAYPRVFLAGSSYYGVGIPDCIANGEEIAARIAQNLS